MYLVFRLIMFFVDGAMATLIRAELSPSGLQLVDPTLAGMPHRINGGGLGALPNESTRKGKR
jgi:cytochrome c oxidase subunit 1